MEQVSDVGRRTRPLPKAGGPTALNEKAPAVLECKAPAVLKYESSAIAEVFIGRGLKKNKRKSTQQHEQRHCSTSESS
jgi:hypothetical protein